MSGCRGFRIISIQVPLYTIINKSIFEDVNQVLPAQVLILKQRLSYFGFITCIESDSFKKPIMIKISEGKQTRGRRHEMDARNEIYNKADDGCTGRSKKRYDWLETTHHGCL